MTKEEYKYYLQSNDWDLIRNFRLSEDNHTCQRCGIKYGLQVHHLTYERVGSEYIEDLITLCGDCHKWIEKKKYISGGLSKEQQLRLLKNKEVNEMYLDDLIGVGGSGKGRSGCKGVTITHCKNGKGRDNYVRIALGEDALRDLKQPEKIGILFGRAYANRLFILNAKDCSKAENVRPYKCSGSKHNEVRISYKFFEEINKPIPNAGEYALETDDQSRTYVKL